MKMGNGPKVGLGNIVVKDGRILPGFGGGFLSILDLVQPPEINSQPC